MKTTENTTVARFPNYVSNLRVLNKEQRHSLPISIDQTGSVISKYGDNVWDFYPYIHPNNTEDNLKRIEFATVVFADGSRLTDPQHETLLASAKAFLYCRLANPDPRSHKILKPRSLKGRAEGTLRPLLQWMVAAGYASFTSLTPQACLAYVKHCKQTTAWERSLGVRRGNPLSPSSLHKRFGLLENLYVFRDHLEDSLPEHPWPESSAYFLAVVEKSSAHEQGKTELIPNRLTKKLAQQALHYIDTDYGEKLLDCRDARMAGEPLKNHLVNLKLKNWLAVKNEIIRLLTAAYIVCDLLSGLRDSEMASLERGCYREHEGWDGAIYGWIYGTNYKTEKDPKPAEWMVPPVVKKALDLVERATAPLRAKAEKQIAVLEARMDNNVYATPKIRQEDLKTLHRLERCRRALFLGEANKNMSINVMGNKVINGRLKAFATHIDLRVEASDMEFVQNRDRINVGNIWPLAPHQFRKTFAVTVAGNTLGDLRYLRKHFNHWSLDMTLYYANSEQNLIDQTLFEEILTERDEIQACIFAGWLGTDKPLIGAQSNKIIEYRERKEVLAYKDLKDLARKLGNGFFVRGTGHSWCVSEDCKGLGVFDVKECDDCENRFIDETHLHVWRGIRQQQIDLLTIDDIGDPMWKRAIEDLRYAEKILANLGDEFEPHPTPPMPSERREIA